MAGHPAPAAFATLGAVTLRNSLGGEVWGLDGVSSAATRTIMAGLIPPLLLLFLRVRDGRWLPAYWGLLGVLFNVHPVSAYHLAQVTVVAHVWHERARPRALAQVALGVGLFVVGTLPYTVPFFVGREGGGAPAVVRAALDYRFPYLFYPIAPNALLSVAFHMALPLGAWLAWRRHREPNAVLTPLAPVMAAAVMLGFVGTAAVQALGAWLDRPYLDIQELRVLRLTYPILLGGLALVYGRRCRARAWVAVVALVVVSLIPPGEVIHAFSHETRGAVKHALGFGPKPVPAIAVDLAPRRALWAWTVAATPPAALFFTDDFEFRLRTRRSITGSFKDGAFMFLAGSGPLAAWYTLERERTACRAAGGAGCWFDLARRLAADYAVLDPSLAAAAAVPPADFAREWAEGGWSVWRRRGAGVTLAYYSVAARQEFWTEHWGGHTVAELLAVARASPLTELVTGALPPTGLVLEAGCGLGQYVLLLRERGRRAVGADWQRRGARRLPPGGAGAPRRHGSLGARPPPGTVAAYVSLGVVEHDPDGPDAHPGRGPAGAGAGRRRWFSVPYWNGARRLGAPWIARGAGPRCARAGGQFYQYAFSRRELLAALGRHGLRDPRPAPLRSRASSPRPRAARAARPSDGGRAGGGSRPAAGRRARRAARGRPPALYTPPGAAPPRPHAPRRRRGAVRARALYCSR